MPAHVVRVLDHVGVVPTDATPNALMQAVSQVARQRLSQRWVRTEQTYRSSVTAAMLMVSSSAVIAKMLKDLRLEHERAGQQALGIAVLEDIVAIVMITLLGSYTKIGSASAESR